MPGRPDVAEGLVAWAQPSRTDGTFVRDRAGRPRVRRVVLRSEPGMQATRPDRLTDQDWTWATSAPRRWESVVKRFGDRAAEVTLDLARNGCIGIEHDFHGGAIREPPRRWLPDPDLHRAHVVRQRSEREARDALSSQAQSLAARLVCDWPGVAGSLRLQSWDRRLEWVVRAADDLAEGRSHDGVRQFAHRHALDTKARDDLPQLLRGLGWEPEALGILGVSRSPYVGVGGPIRLRGGDHVIDLAGWPGPHDMRLPPGRPISVWLPAGVDDLLVIENRQAAEAMCDSDLDLPVIWCHGQPSDAVLDVIVQAARGVERILLCPDADLGGVRIAGRIHNSISSLARTITVVDAGTVDHPRGREFGSTALELLARETTRDDAIGAFAKRCLSRGYAVEQEAPMRAAIRRVLQR